MCSKYIKYFSAGLLFPAVFLPIVFGVLCAFGHQSVRSGHLIVIPLAIPIVFGLWNILYFLIGDKCPIKSRYCRLWAHGVILGLLLAPIGVFCFQVPQRLFGLTGNWIYLAFVFVPLIYGVIWRYVIHYLNQTFGLNDPDRLT